DVQDQCSRIIEHVVTQDYQDEGIVSERTGSVEAAVHGVEKRCREMAKGERAELGRRPEPVCSTVGGSNSRGRENVACWLRRPVLDGGRKRGCVEKPECWRSGGIAIVAYKRSWRKVLRRRT